MSFNPRCPFHTAALTTAVLASFSYAYFYFTSKVKEIKRFDIDSRFTDSIKFNNMVFISGQVGDGETIEEQTISALNYVDVALSKAGTNKSRILELTIWMANIDANYDKMNVIYDKWITPGLPPTRACIEAKLASPKYKIEVRVVAAAL